MEPELISGLVGSITSIATLGFFYWRSLKIAKASLVGLESRLTQEITTLKDRSQATESGLQSQLTEVNSQLQTSEVTRAKLAEEVVALTQQCQRLREELMPRLYAKYGHRDILVEYVCDPEPQLSMSAVGHLFPTK